MEYTNNGYRSEMRTPFRGESSVYAYMGLINSDAQQTAHITSSFSGDESLIYGSPSEDYEGVTSTEEDGSITFTFDYYELNIAGLTISFKTVPSAITVTNGDKTGTYTVDQADFVFDDGYMNCHYLKITPASGKLSIKSIIFGIGLQFTNKQIISTSRENVVNHISNELPRKRFSITVDNRSHMYNRDNPKGYASYIQEKQEIVFEYGRELNDGTIYRIKGGKVVLKSWSSDDYKATFNFVGYLDYLEGQYTKGRYYEDGITAFDLARDVFIDAGVTNYKLDEFLKKIIIHNPIPPCEYTEALQMIANASMCVLMEDRDGDICIKNADRPSFVGEVEFTGATNYSNASTIFEDNSLNNYADSEFEYAKADGTLLFLPERSSYKSVGFVSSQIADENGLFSNNPSVYVKFESEYRLQELTLNFGVIVPTSVTVTFKWAGVIVGRETITELSLATHCAYVGTVDEIFIAFNSARPNQRIHLNNMRLEGYIDYELTYHELKESPNVTSLERVSKLEVHAYSYDDEVFDSGANTSIDVETVENPDGGESFDISTEQGVYTTAVAIMEAEIGLNYLTFDRAYYNYTASAGTIVESGAYYIVVESDEDQDIEIYAQPYTISDTTFEVNIHEKGSVKRATNPLIDTLAMASQQAAWLRDYYDDDLEYSLTYRGDPILDADDQIYLENHFVYKNEIRIVEESINTSMGMDFTCKILARRTSFQVDATIDTAIVGRMRVGERISQYL